METVRQIGPALGIALTCAAVGLAKATFYRQLAPMHGPHARRTSSRALSTVQRQAVLDVLHEPRFEDFAPAEIWATLLDEKKYLCSERTMYRILEENQEVRERRNQLLKGTFAAPELLATAPKQVWSWDISVPQQAA